jgi:hypothetical protein
LVLTLTPDVCPFASRWRAAGATDGGMPVSGSGTDCGFAAGSFMPGGGSADPGGGGADDDASTFCARAAGIARTAAARIHHTCIFTASLRPSLLLAAYPEAM